MEKTLTLDESKAKALYPKADAAFKELLEANFGKKVLIGNVTDRVKSFEDACNELDIDPVSVFTNKDLSDEVAYKQLKVIAKALNEGWLPDWKDTDQYKYYPWFYMDVTRYSTPGFRLFVAYFVCVTSAVGSRLCFKSEELAKYAATQFESIYKAFMTI